MARFMCRTSGPRDARRWRNRAPTPAACRRAAARAPRALPRRRPRAGRRRRCLTTCRARHARRAGSATRARSTRRRFACERRFGDRPGIEGAHLAVELDRARRPVDAAPRTFRSWARRSRPRPAARAAVSVPAARPSSASISAAAPSSDSASCRSPAVSCRPIGRRALEQHGAGVEPRVELHDGDAGFRVAGEDGALDRRGAAPARQQRTVDVQAAEARQRPAPPAAG